MSDGRMILTVDRIEEGVAVCLKDDGTVTNVMLDDGLDSKVRDGDRIRVTDVDGVYMATEILPVCDEEEKSRKNRRSRLKGLFGKK